MPQDAQLAFIDAKGGMNAADKPHKIAANQFARGTNIGISNGYPGTRHGIRVVPLSGDDAEFIAINNVQGSIFFNPAKGQGGIILGESNPRLALAAGGRKYVVGIEGQGDLSKAKVTIIPGGLVTNSQLHLVWWSAWEDLLLAQDGQANCIVWDSVGDATFSAGYDTIDKPSSEIPNGGTVMAYVHARGVTVVNSRQILVGDSLHRTNQTTSINLRGFTEQVYWATGQHFLPPSAMGGINAAAILPIRDTTHGHSDLMIHCEDGVFSLDLSQFPRSSWSDKNLVRHVLLQSGATGPYAVAIYDGDQLYRTRKGVQTLRSAAAESRLEGNPNQTISNQVNTWLSADYKRWLRFASVALWEEGRRFFVTTQPIVQGRWRWHRGFVVRNTDPAESEVDTPAVWEGIWTLPPSCAGVIQFVGGIFDGEDRMFAWVRGSDGRNKLVEFCSYLREDILEDGTRHPIRSQLITRAMDAGQWWKTREFTDGKLFLLDVIGRVRWGVWVRSAESPEWVPWRAGVVEVPELGPGEADIAANPPRPISIPLGRIPDGCNDDGTGKTSETRSIQCLIRWEGSCKLEGIRVEHGDTELKDVVLDKEMLDVTFKNAAIGDYDDFEYSSTDSPTWISDN